MKEIKIDIYLILSLIFPLVVSTIFFNTNKAIWWDEGEYLLGARGYLEGDTSGIWIGRPPFFPLLMAPLFKIFGESVELARVVNLVFYILSSLFVFLLAKELTNKKKTSLIASIIFSSSWMVIFYSIRILVHTPQTFFTILFLYFLVKAKDNFKLNLLAGIFASIAFGMRWDAIVPIAISFVLIFFTYKKNFIPYLIGLFIPIFILGIHDLIIHKEFLGSALTFFLQLLNPKMQTKEAIGGAYAEWYQYFLWLPHIFTWPVVILVILTIIFLFTKIKKRSNFFLVSFFILYFVLFSALTNKQDRFFIPLIPVASIICAVGINILSDFVKGYKLWAMIILVAIVMYFNFSGGGAIIYEMGDSFVEIKWAGELLRDKIQEGEIIMCMSTPMMEWYSNANVIPYPKEESDFIQEISQKNIKYVILAPYDNLPGYISSNYKNYDFLIPIDGYQRYGQTTAVIFEVN